MNDTYAGVNHATFEGAVNNLLETTQESQMRFQMRGYMEGTCECSQKCT